MAQRTKAPALRVPEYDAIVGSTGMLTTVWQNFFRYLKTTIAPLGIEQSFDIVNNQVDIADVEGLKVSKSNTSLAIVDYLIQRVTTGTNPVEKIESGSFHLIYMPTQDVWVKVNATVPPAAPSPYNAEVTLTVTTDGQVQYVSTLVDGTASISKMFYRIRTLTGKNTQYSSV